MKTKLGTDSELQAKYHATLKLEGIESILHSTISYLQTGQNLPRVNGVGTTSDLSFIGTDADCYQQCYIALSDFLNVDLETSVVYYQLLLMRERLSSVAELLGSDYKKYVSDSFTYEFNKLNDQINDALFKHTVADYVPSLFRLLDELNGTVLYRNHCNSRVLAKIEIPLELLKPQQHLRLVESLESVG